MKLRKTLVQMTTAAVLMLGSANASELIPAAKVDSGLGDLPPYREWSGHPELARFVVEGQVAGEKRDSGLGGLPPYAEWGRYPELARLFAGNRVPGEKLDNGLGELPRYSEWKNDPDLARLAAPTTAPAWQPVALQSR